MVRVRPLPIWRPRFSVPVHTRDRHSPRRCPSPNWLRAHTGNPQGRPVSTSDRRPTFVVSEVMADTRRRRALFRAGAASVLFVFLASWMPAGARAADEVGGEYRLEAAFIHRFPQFVT